MMNIQSELSERAIELLALDKNEGPRLVLDIGCGTGLSGGKLTFHLVAIFVLQFIIYLYIYINLFIYA